MPLETCLQAVSEQSEKLHVKSLGMALRSRIQEGYTLSDSLREHPRVFDSLFCSMVAAGEKSGHLDVVLNRLADYTEQRQRLKSRLLQAMLYPLVLLVVATGVVTILLRPFVKGIARRFSDNTHDPAFRPFLEADPLQPRQLPTAWVGALARWIKRIEAAPRSPRRPVIVQGEEDMTVDWQHNLQVLRGKFDEPEVLMLARGRHHLANEISEIREEYFQYLTDHLK